QLLQRSFITPEVVHQAGVYRVPSLEGRDLVGRKDGGDYAGINFPYRWPGEEHSVLDRLRLDNPPIDAATGKAQHKYLTAPGARNRLYLPPCDAALTTDRSIAVLLLEGEKKVLGTWCAATNNGTSPAFLPIGIPGVWGFKTTVGTRINAKGERVAEKGI